MFGLERLHCSLLYDFVLQKFFFSVSLKLGDNCIVFENFMASIGDLMIAN
jgi:hypothetical protein